MGDRTRIAQKLNLDEGSIVAAAVLNNGPEWHAFELRSAADVLAVDSALVKWPNEKGIGLIGPHPTGSECEYEVRMLAPSSGMSEDPITGSLNAALAHWFAQAGKLRQSMVVAQGTRINRQGRVFVSRDPADDSTDLIGGRTQIIIEGSEQL